ncbi:hypothetical protein [Vibrio sp. LaRot3]|uniref:hypothetical protein n=1 Tax=Vibrio sp. LaRot3 TaxID=2998829 RepID=UPI0022CE0538|nr:hypothetical protein [Vibrio sp. LaRot3]MDA0147073.1 hypothetical protein [Vibrio sp. LaRot3]
MNKLRQQEALQELTMVTNQTYTQIETSVDSMRSRWAALREDYYGIGAEDVESEITTILAQADQLLTKLMDWRDACDPNLQSQQQDEQQTSTASDEEAECNQDG